MVPQISPAEFKALRIALGYSHQDLADKYETDIATVQTWDTDEPPFRAWLDIEDALNRRLDTVHDIIHTAENEQEPITLIAYRTEEECIKTGLTLQAHTAMLVQTIIGLKLCAQDFRVEYAKED